MLNFFYNNAQAESYIVQKGDTASILAYRFYGNEYFSDLLLRANDPGDLKVGQQLKILELKEIVISEGFPKKYKPALDNMQKAWNSYLELYKNKPYKKDVRKKYYQINKKKYYQINIELKKTIKILKNSNTIAGVPKKMIGQLNRCMELIARISQGDFLKYNEHMVGQRMALAFSNGASWGREIQKEQTTRSLKK